MLVFLSKVKSSPHFLNFYCARNSSQSGFRKELNSPKRSMASFESPCIKKIYGSDDIFKKISGSFYLH